MAVSHAGLYELSRDADYLTVDVTVLFRGREVYAEPQMNGRSSSSKT